MEQPGVKSSPAIPPTLLAVAGLLVATTASPQATRPSAAATDPVQLGWMVGAPPPPEKQVRFADGSHMSFPRTRWSFSHFDQFVPSRGVWRGDGPVAALPRALRDDLDAVSFTPLGGTAPMTWRESLDANYTDAILVLHRGHIVYERYFGVTGPQTRHMAFSVTKSLVGTLGAMLVHEGRLDERAPVAKYLPELAESAYADATVRQVMDMTIGLQYSEDYADPKAEIWNYARAGGIVPRPAGYDGPTSLYAFLKTLRKAGSHGEAFAYKTVNTDVLGWLIRRVTGEPLSDLLSERFWQPLGAERDAFILVDSEGTEIAGGGFNPTLRDLARYGEMMRLDGRFNGRQIVPKAVVDDIRRGGDRAAFARAGYALLPGWSYRDMWWVSHDPHGAYTARGVHGQVIYIDPRAEMVIARFGSHPLAANANLDPTSLPAYRAIAAQLMR
jgi:CubicO group peptidase (beta-lactamase class C family)